MTLSEEPCLFQYFLFLVKEKDKLRKPNIAEAQKLWDSICDTFFIDSTGSRILMSVQRSREEIYLEKKVKRLVDFKTKENRILGEQVLAHDMLVICVVINPEKGLKTNEPEKIWSEQLEVNQLSEDLRYLYDTASVLQTITKEPELVVQQIRIKLEQFRADKIESSKFDFGTLWRFIGGISSGSNTETKPVTKLEIGARYLLTIDKHHEELANRFLANNFAYILTLESKIQQHYSQAIKLYNEISNQEDLLAEIVEKIERIDNITDFERIKKHVRSLGKTATDNLTYLRDCGNNIQSNIKNLHSTIEELTVNIESDEIFSPDIALFKEHIDNISSWAKGSENSIMRINKGVIDAQQFIEEQIQKLKTRKIMLRTTMTKPVKITHTLPVKLEWGNSYILNENEPEKSQILFKNITALGKPGFCITRTHPDKLKEYHDLNLVKIKWLSKDNDEMSIPPNPERLSDDITDFLRNNKNGVLFLDGLEYIKTNNDLKKVLKLIDHVKDLVVLYKSTFILPVYFNIFNEKELALVKKNMIDLSDREIELGDLKL